MSTVIDYKSFFDALRCEVCDENSLQNNPIWLCRGVCAHVGCHVCAKCHQTCTGNLTGMKKLNLTNNDCKSCHVCHSAGQLSWLNGVPGYHHCKPCAFCGKTRAGEPLLLLNNKFAHIDCHPHRESKMTVEKVILCTVCNQTRDGIGLLMQNNELAHYDCHKCAICDKSRSGVGLLERDNIWVHHDC